MFQGNAPYLHCLHLLNYSIEFALSMPILLRLTKFSARNITPTIGPSTSMWLMNLLQMPHLHWLRIIDSIAPTHETFSPTQVHLPVLTMLSLSGKFCDCVSLLDHITAPSLISMWLNCSTVEPGHHFTQLLDSIKKNLSAWLLKAGEFPQIILMEHGHIFVGNSRRFSSLDNDAWNVSEVASLQSGCHTNDNLICILSLTWVMLKMILLSAVPCSLPFSQYSKWRRPWCYGLMMIIWVPNRYLKRCCSSESASIRLNIFTPSI